jgi:hypothetical protein
MAADIVSSNDVFLILGIQEPTDLQFNTVELLRKGVEASVRNQAKWQITEDTLIAFLPEYNKPTAPTVGTANFASVYSPSSGAYFQSRIRNRIQLPTFWVKEIVSVYVDNGALAGNGPDDFANGTLLNPEADYYLESSRGISGGTAWGESGGLIRSGRSWPSTPATVRVEFVSGFSAADLNGDFYDLKVAIIQEVAARWQARQRIANPNTGIKSEKLGDYSYTLNTFDSDYVPFTGGLSQGIVDFLNSNGYSMFVGV